MAVPPSLNLLGEIGLLSSLVSIFIFYILLYLQWQTVRCIFVNKSDKDRLDKQQTCTLVGDEPR